MAVLSVALLGGFHVEVDDMPVSPDAWRSRRAADVIKLLALAGGHRLRREQVLDALWPDLAPDAAAANLRKAVHYARRALGSELAISSAHGVLTLWPTGPVITDVAKFLEACAAAQASTSPVDAAAAADRYTGELLPDDRYEAWTDSHRDTLRRRYLQMLRAAHRWERVVEIDPYDESAYRALMRRALEQGNRAEALRLYGQLKDRLDADLGVTPSAATVQLYRAIFAIEAPAHASPAEQVRSLIARGVLGYWGRTDLREAETLAADARTLALDAGLGDELGEASALLAILALYRGTWWTRFRKDLQFCMRQPSTVAVAIFDQLLCFVEFYLDGPEGLGEPDAVAHDTLRLAVDAQSIEAEALARLMLGEVHLLAGRTGSAEAELRRAVELAERCGWIGCQSLALQRTSQAALTLGRRAEAAAMAEQAALLASKSGLVNHLLVRALDAQVSAAEDQVEALAAAEVVRRGTPTCEPCAIGYLMTAVDVCAASGHTDRAGRFLDEAERISGLWRGGPWQAAVWEARGKIRRAEGDLATAAVFFGEAAQRFGKAHRSVAEARCRTLAAAIA
jgi:DNA-binding SARP family transcriptional activator